MGRGMAVFATIVLFALGTPACTSDGGDGGSATRGEDGEPKLTPWEQELAELPESGLVGKKQALRLFAMAFGPVPGVDAPKNTKPIPDATIAVEAVMAHLDEYTPKQRRAIERLLEPPPGSVTIEIPPVNETAPPPAAPAVRAAQPVGDEFQRWADMVANLYREGFADPSRLGFDIPGNITMKLWAKQAKGEPKANGWTSPKAEVRNGKVVQGTYSGCTISISPDSLRNPDRPGNALLLTIAHEVFHCFQFAVVLKRLPGWIADGSAEYAASEITGLTSGFWPGYLTTPNKHLFTRVYDALGFYAHLQETDIDPYSKMRDMWLAVGNQAAYNMSGATSEAFLDSWASGYSRGEVRGEAWNMTGPGITPDKPKPVKITVPKDGESPLKTVGEYQNQIYKLDIKADLVEVETEGHVRVSDGTTDVVAIPGQQFCARKEGCACPGEGDPDIPELPIKREASLGLSGGVAGASVVLTGVSLTQRCCAEQAPITTAGGLTITPIADCTIIGLQIDKADGLKLSIAFGLYVDHPRLVPQVTKKGVVQGVELRGITGMVLDFGAGTANSASDNDNIEVDVPLEIEVPVQPPRRGLPRSMKVTWSIEIKTAITGDNSTLIARGRYGLAGPLSIRNGKVTGPTPSVEESLTNSIQGITLGPSGIVIAVKTKFSAGAGTPAAMKGTFAALTASFGVANGSSLAAPYVRCFGASLDLVLSGGQGKATDKKPFFQAKEIVPPDTKSCGTL